MTVEQLRDERLHIARDQAAGAEGYVRRRAEWDPQLEPLVRYGDHDRATVDPALAASAPKQ